LATTASSIRIPRRRPGRRRTICSGPGRSGWCKGGSGDESAGTAGWKRSGRMPAS